MSVADSTIVEVAANFKAVVEGRMETLRQSAAALVGREHHKARTTLGKEIAGLRADPKYIDACRVVKGLSPAHGNFADEIASTSDEKSLAGESVKLLDPKEAAKHAEEIERALADLEPPREGKTAMTFTSDGLLADEDSLHTDWQHRLTKLESTMVEGAATVAPESVDELQRIANEMVFYRNILKKVRGYRNKDLRDEVLLRKLEERLDVLAGVFLAEPEPVHSLAEELAELDHLRNWERDLGARIVRHHEKTAGLGPAEAREVEKLVGEIADLKAKLRVEGLTEHEQDRDEQVLIRFVRLSELRQKQRHDKKHAKRETNEKKADLKELEQLKGELESHKRKIVHDCGHSHRDLQQDPIIRELEERLSVLERLGGTRCSA